jgi:hypothetical protein
MSMDMTNTRCETDRPCGQSQNVKCSRTLKSLGVGEKKKKGILSKVFQVHIVSRFFISQLIAFFAMPLRRLSGKHPMKKDDR